MSTVFISYRRETAAGEARALFNDLVAQLGDKSVFMDVDSIALGRDFRGVLQDILGRCDIMLVLIDRNWVDVKDERGRVRLENSSDFVRLEIETALKRNIIVTPVLVQSAHIPAPEQLPLEIKDLAYRNCFELSHNRWESDVREMVKRLDLDDSGATKGADAARSFSSTKQARKQTGKPGWKAPFVRISARLTVVIGIIIIIPVAMLGHYLTRSSISPSPGNSAIGSHFAQSEEQFALPDYVGSWVNADPATRGITRIEVRYAAGKPTVQVWGKCHPNDCDWGTIDATQFRSSIASGSGVTSLGATFKPSFAESQLKLRLIDKNELSVTDMTHFTDGSGRADYEKTEKFRRS